eukprot:NODE_31004_length_406_cov_0.885305.p2 GENE.NODE_31004_length_406_cov_0.885305~~NODE_31004_length_406_cov_0.885305.p2  ORF type:complete len:101 (+),score=13.12 NODE_31004_length_406_cov_0.885305:3-305(+)
MSLGPSALSPTSNPSIISIRCRRASGQTVASIFVKVGGFTLRANKTPACTRAEGGRRRNTRYQPPPSTPPISRRDIVVAAVCNYPAVASSAIHRRAAAVA